MIKTMKRRYRIGCLLFSICFFIYAVSPLSAIYQQREVIGQTTSAVNSIRLLVVELLLYPPAQEDDGNGTSSRVLLRKKRATLSADKLKRSKKQIENCAVVSNSITSSEAPTLWIVAQDNGPKIQNGSHLPHSGLSPPLV